MLGIFGLGTLPIFLCYGLFVGTLNKVRAQWADTITASILVIFGVLMLGRSYSYSGIHLGNAAIGQEILHAVPIMCDSNKQTFVLKIDGQGWNKNQLSFQEGQRIRLIIHAKEITSFNQLLEIPELGLIRELQKGMNVIEFDPGQHLALNFTCCHEGFNGALVAR